MEKENSIVLLMHKILQVQIGKKKYQKPRQKLQTFFFAKYLRIWTNINQDYLEIAHLKSNHKIFLISFLKWF